MSLTVLIREYLERARECERLAEGVADADLKANWMKIAQSYRGMAQHHLDKVTGHPLGEQPAQMPAAKAEPGDLLDPPAPEG